MGEQEWGGSPAGDGGSAFISSEGWGGGRKKDGGSGFISGSFITNSECWGSTDNV